MVKRKKYEQRTVHVSKWQTEFTIDGLYLPSGSNEDDSGDFVIHTIWVIGDSGVKYRATKLGNPAREELAQEAFQLLEVGD
jgi:hypothetical protein